MLVGEPCLHPFIDIIGQLVLPIRSGTGKVPQVQSKYGFGIHGVARSGYPGEIQAYQKFMGPVFCRLTCQNKFIPSLRFEVQVVVEKRIAALPDDFFDTPVQFI